jgi:putative salt-induced outer membrane protein YdiY
MPADTYHRLVEVSPKPWEAWTGTATVGDNLQHGNQETNTVTSAISMVHEREEAPIFRPHLRTNFGYAGLFSHATQSSSFVTSRTLSSNLREDILLTPRDFLFGVAQFEHVSTSGLYLRQTYGGGFGFNVIQTSRTTFDLTGGLTFQHQKFFNGSFEQGATALAGEKIGEQLTKRIRFDHTLTFYPDFSQLGQYRFDTTTTLTLKLSSHFSLVSSAIDLFLSNPPPHNQRNNITLTTGVGYTF